jgi:energy-coupling factor transporter ATP-binding protein EcfA2
MRVKSLHVENLLTFDTFDLCLDGGSHTLVGPNGSGKSNVVRLFDLVAKAVDSSAGNSRSPLAVQSAEQVLRSFAAAHHYGQPSHRPAEVRLAFELSTPSEKVRLATFVRAAILCTLAEEIRQGDPQIKLSISDWVEAEVTDDKLDSLYAGTIVLRHVGLAHLPWDVSFEFVHKGVPYTWYLSYRSLSHGIVRSSEPPAGLTGVPAKQLQDCLLGIASMPSKPVQLPSPMPPFDLTSMCPQPHELVTPMMIRTGTGTFDQVLMPFRTAIELLGLPQESGGGQITFPLAFVLSMLLDDGVVTLGEPFRGLALGGPTPQQAGVHPSAPLVSPFRTRAPWALPMRLFELKNGNPEQRERYRKIQATFTDLAPGRAVDVKFQVVDPEAMNPAAIGTGQVTLFPPSDEADAPRDRPGAALTVVVDRTGQKKLHPEDLPIQLHGGGTWEALVMAEALVGAEGRFVILDEPALTLHPTWQRALRSRIQDAGGTFLVITHSANLVPMTSPEQLARLVRLESESGATNVHRFPIALLKGEISRVVREFSLSAEAISLLFARGVVLLEGETELGTLPKWFEKCAAAESNMRPADLDLAFYSVGGDNNFRTLVSVMHAFAIPWVLICDGALFDVAKRQKRNPHIFRQVLDAGAQLPELQQYLHGLGSTGSKRVMSDEEFTLATSIGRMHGILTLATGWSVSDKTAGTPNDECFEAFLDLVAPGQLHQAKESVGDSKVRKGLWVAEKVECPKEVSDLYGEVMKGLQQRGLAHTSA